MGHLKIKILGEHVLWFSMSGKQPPLISMQTICSILLHWVSTLSPSIIIPIRKGLIMWPLILGTLAYMYLPPPFVICSGWNLWYWWYLWWYCLAPPLVYVFLKRVYWALTLMLGSGVFHCRGWVNSGAMSSRHRNLKPLGRWHTTISLIISVILMHTKTSYRKDPGKMPCNWKNRVPDL